MFFFRRALLRAQSREDDEDTEEEEEEEDGLNIFDPAPPAVEVYHEDEEDHGDNNLDDGDNLAGPESLDDIPEAAPPSSPQSRSWAQLAKRLCPIEEGFSQAGCGAKIWMVANAPATFVLSATVPGSDPWCRYLTVLHCYITPLAMALALDLQSAEIAFGVRAWQAALVTGQVMAVAVLCSTPEEPSSPPHRAYHVVLPWAGLAASYAWAYAAAGELCSILVAAGAASGMPDAILNLTLLAWGRAAVTVASVASAAGSSMPRMGYSACFAGPILSLLLGMGVPFSWTVTRQGGPIKLDLTPTSLALCASLAASAAANLLLLPASKFRAGRLQGTVLLAVHLLCLAGTVLAQLDLLPFT